MTGPPSVIVDYLLFSRILHKLNQIVHTYIVHCPFLSGFFPLKNYLRFIHIFYISLNFIPEQHSFHTTICSSIYLLIDILVVSSLWLLKINLLWTIVYKSLWGICFYFSWVNTKHRWAVSYGRWVLSFWRNCQPVFLSDFSFHIPARSVWEFQLFHTSADTWNSQCINFLLQRDKFPET